MHAGCIVIIKFFNTEIKSVKFSLSVSRIVSETDRLAVYSPVFNSRNPLTFCGNRGPKSDSKKSVAQFVDSKREGNLKSWAGDGIPATWFCVLWQGKARVNVMARVNVGYSTLQFYSEMKKKSNITMELTYFVHVWFVGAGCLFLRWWPPSTMWVGSSIFEVPPPGISKWYHLLLFRFMCCMLCTYHVSSRIVANSN